MQPNELASPLDEVVHLRGDGEVHSRGSLLPISNSHEWPFVSHQTRGRVSTLMYPVGLQHRTGSALLLSANRPNTTAVREAVPRLCPLSCVRPAANGRTDV